MTTSTEPGPPADEEGQAEAEDRGGHQRQGVRRSDRVRTPPDPVTRFLAHRRAQGVDGLDHRDHDLFGAGVRGGQLPLGIDVVAERRVARRGGWIEHVEHGLQRRQAVHARHAPVEQDQVEHLAVEQIERARPVRRVGDAIALVLKVAGQHVGEQRIVVDQEQAFRLGRLRRRHGPPPSGKGSPQGH